jgi:prepilin-type N-terminal cleavage/methylation domain-containing protein
MMISRKKLSSRRRGFTLIELLTVIAIIGILAAVVIPTVGSVRGNAQRSASAANMRSIAQAYANFSGGGGRVQSINQPTIYEWARVLAEEVDLIDASLYFIESDPAVTAFGALPQVVAFTDPTSGSTTLGDGWVGSPVSYSVANRLSPNAASSTTPLLWTFGLTPAGTWSVTPVTPWEGRGGHIAFLDSSVRYFNRTVGTSLLNYTTRVATADVTQAINPGANVLSGTRP